MKRLLIFIVLLGLAPVVNAEFLGIKQASETVSFFLNKPLDSLYGIPRKPDSVHVFTYADNATAATFQTRSTTFPFSDISIDTLKHFTDTMYIFKDAIQDIDGAGGHFALAIEVQLYYDKIPTVTHATVQIISDSLENMLDASKDSSSSAAVIAQINADSLDSQDGWGAKEATLAYFDTLIYIGEHGLGVFIDSTAGNTNTVVGVDGTEKNPVSTLAAGRTIALALGAHRFYLHGGSTFNGAGTDLAADYSEWEFYGEGHGIGLAFGGQLVTNSYFHNITLSGAMHASGGDVFYQDCDFGFISANFNGTADNCWLTDTLVVKNGRDLMLSGCQSGVPGNQTPTIDFGGGSSSLSLRGYSGGIRIMSGSSNDTVSIETDGQVIVSANNTSMTLALRGMMTVTDSGTTTNITKDAVFSRQEGNLWVWDPTYDATLKSLVVSNSAGDAVQFKSTGGNGSGLELTGIGAGSGLYAQATNTGDGIFAAGGVSDGDGMDLFAQGGTGKDMHLSGTGTASDGTDAVLMTKDTAGLVDNIWNEDSTGHYTTPNMAFLAAQTGAGSSITDADMAAIADTVLNRDTSDVSTAGSIGEQVRDTTTYQGTSAAITDADMVAIADTVLNRDTSDVSTAGSIGLQVRDTTTYQGPCLPTAGSTIGIYTIDTTSWPTTDTIGAIPVVVKDSATGTVYSTAQTNSSGFTTVPLVDGTYTFEAGEGAAYDFQAEYLTVASADDTAFMYGEAYVAPSPTVGHAATVSVVIKDNTGAGLAGVYVTAYLSGSNLADSSGAGIANTTQRKKTNASGIATFTCLWSGYILPATKWNFSGHSPSIGGFKRTVTIPSQATFTLDLATY